MSRRWTTPQDIEAKVRRRWDDGSLLKAHAGELPFTPIETPVRGPRPAEIGDDLVAVREWIGALTEASAGGRRFDLSYQTVGGRHFGRNELPARVRVGSLEQAFALLGVTRQVKVFDALLGLADAMPSVRAWVLAHPRQALALADELPALIAASTWLDQNRSSERYLREISAPGVDTKFAEKHRAVLAAILGVPGSSSGFLRELGLRNKPEFVRIRVCDTLGLPRPLSELALRRDELADLAIAPEAALVVENEISYLSVPVPPGGVVIWGKGFEVDRVGRMPWLANIPVTYWGDIDTHGFAILDRLRAWLPHTASVLMDRDTLEQHRDRWGTETSPGSSNLVRLTPTERDLYADLVHDRLGRRIRLEQERIDWGWVSRHLRLT